MKNDFQEELRCVGSPPYSNLPMDRIYAWGNVLRKSDNKDKKKTTLQRVGAIFMALFLYSDSKHSFFSFTSCYFSFFFW